MATKLYGYGEHAIATNDDFDIQCIRLDEPRAGLLTVGLTFNGFDGNFTLKSRRRGSSQAFKAQSYVLQDGTLSSSAISADTTVQVDATGKDIRITSANRTTGTASLGFDVADEA